MSFNTVRIATIACTLALAACGSDGGGDVAATQSDIQAKIFNQSCTLSSCHGSAAEGELDLRAGAMRDETINVPAQKAALDIIEPGDPDNSFLVIKLEGPSGSQGDLMPQGSPKLSAAKIQAIRDWISAGAPNN